LERKPIKGGKNESKIDLQLYMYMNNINMTEPLLRQNKGNFKVIRTPGSDITKMSPYLEKVWNEWENENSELTKNMIYPILKKFISGENIPSGRIIDNLSEDLDNALPYYTIQINETTLILIGLKSDDQKYLMLACKQMGLQCIPPDPPKRGMFWCC
jgi:hypothetical protein